VLEKDPDISEAQMKNLRADEATLLKALPQPSTLGDCIERLVQSSYGADLWGEAEERGWFTKRKVFLGVIINFVARAIISFPLILFCFYRLEDSLITTAIIHTSFTIIHFPYILNLRKASLFKVSLLIIPLMSILFFIIFFVTIGAIQFREWLFAGSTVLLWGVMAMEVSSPYRWYTATGLECKKQWEVFRKWLKEGSQLEREDERTLESYLPYAIALKVEKSFIKRAEKVLGHKPKLSWYTRSFSAKGWSWRGAANAGEEAAQGFSGGRRESSASGSWNDFFSALPQMLNQVASSIASIKRQRSKRR
jgi:hypothetical protein